MSIIAYGKSNLGVLPLYRPIEGLPVRISDKGIEEFVLAAISTLRTAL